jgi:GTPase SAR1 family protein
MLLGDSGVGKFLFLWKFPLSYYKIGKTCLLIRFNDETFLTGNFSTTVGIDYRNKIVTLGDKKINLQIFDTVS